jgi:hypothetical protein
MQAVFIRPAGTGARSLLLRMFHRVLLALCLLGFPALAQNKPTDKTLLAEPQQSSVPKGRLQPMEHHSRTQWRYHSGPKRSTPAGDSSAMQQSPTRNTNGTDAGK